MSEDDRPRYKERVDIGPDIAISGEGPHDSGRSRTNIGTRSHKPKRNGKSLDWMPKN